MFTTSPSLDAASTNTCRPAACRCGRRPCCEAFQFRVTLRIERSAGDVLVGQSNWSAPREGAHVTDCDGSLEHSRPPSISLDRECLRRCDGLLHVRDREQQGLLELTQPISLLLIHQGTLTALFASRTKASMEARVRSSASGSRCAYVLSIWSTLVPMKRASSNSGTPAAIANVA
jgi:hypothetical protein